MKNIDKATELSHDLEKVIVDDEEYIFISYHLNVVCLLPYAGYVQKQDVLFINCVNDVPERSIYVL